MHSPAHYLCSPSVSDRSIGWCLCHPSRTIRHVKPYCNCHPVGVFNAGARGVHYDFLKDRVPSWSNRAPFVRSCINN